jgi:hypothetical protein
MVLLCVGALAYLWQKEVAEHAATEVQLHTVVKSLERHQERIRLYDEENYTLRSLLSDMVEAEAVKCPPCPYDHPIQPGYDLDGYLHFPKIAECENGADPYITQAGEYISWNCPEYDVNPGTTKWGVVE